MMDKNETLYNQMPEGYRKALYNRYTNIMHEHPEAYLELLIILNKYEKQTPTPSVVIHEDGLVEKLSTVS